MKASELMTGNLVMVNKGGLCIKKGTIVRVVEVDSENKLPEKGLVGSARCVDVNDRSVSGGIWCAYLAPIPVSPEILEKSGFKKGQIDCHLIWRNDHDEVCATLIGGDVVEISYAKWVFNPEDPDELDYGSQMECPNGCALHQFQQFLTICGIEKEITLDGISVKEG